MTPEIQTPFRVAPREPGASSLRLIEPFDSPKKLEDDDDRRKRRPPKERPLSREEIDELVERVLEEELERLRDADEPAS
jgi:hypothetical protein